MKIEVRIQARNNNILRGNYDESPSFKIDIDPVTAKSVLNELVESEFLSDYVKNNGVSVNLREKPTLKKELTQSDEFYFSLPVPGMNQDQSFIARVILS